VIEEAPIAMPSNPVDSLLLQITSLPAHITTDKEALTELSPPNKIIPEDVPEKPVQPVEPTEKWKEELKLHVVRPGQTYYSVSQLYGVPLKQLYVWNNLSERIPLKVGQELIVNVTKKRSSISPKPTGITTVKVPAKPAALVTTSTSVIKPAEPFSFTYYVVQAGQTVYRVALINKVSVPDLMRWNKLTNYTIEVGQKLLIRRPK
jgi:membrane-bound lytic murein transglycosylase D